MKEKKIFIQPRYSVLRALIYSVLIFALLLIPQFVSLEGTQEQRIAFYALISSIGAALFVWFIRFLEFAIISQDGIVIKSPFGKIAELKWDDIKSVRLGVMVTVRRRRHRSSIVKEWIVVYTGEINNTNNLKLEKRLLRRNGLNKRGCGAYVINATPQNQDVIEEFVKQYRSDLTDTLFKGFYED